MPVDLNGLTEGEHQLRATVSDLVGHATVSEPWTIYLDKTPPSQATEITASWSSVTNRTRIAWEPGTDAALLADGTEALESVSQRVRYRVGDGPFTDWVDVPGLELMVDGVPAGVQVIIKVTMLDGVGNMVSASASVAVDAALVVGPTNDVLGVPVANFAGIDETALTPTTPEGPFSANFPEDNVQGLRRALTPVEARVRAFAPVLRFHPDESFFPTAVDPWVARSQFFQFTGGLLWVWLTGCCGVLSCRLGGLVECFIFNWGKPPEPALTTPAVVGPLDPGVDRKAEFLPGFPPLTVKDVLLQEAEE